MIDGLIRFCLDKAMTSYYAAMEEQASIIVSIITALSTGGFIILFLDNQHVGATVIERYHFVMRPFMHRLSNYFKFLSSATTYFSITKGTKKDEAEYVFKFNDLMDKLGHYAYPCIMSGQDYPASKFTAKQLENICNDINIVMSLGHFLLKFISLYNMSLMNMNIGVSKKNTFKRQPIV